MADYQEPDSRGNLTLGAKISLLVAIPLLVMAVFQLFAPITEVRTGTGAVFYCGTAVNAPSGKFAENVCSKVNKRHLFHGASNGPWTNADPRTDHDPLRVGDVKRVAVGHDDIR